MSKLQGYHLILLFASYMTSYHKTTIDIDSYIQAKVPGTLANFKYAGYIMIAIMLFMLRSTEHAILIWCLLAAYKSVRTIASNSHIEHDHFVVGFLFSALLVSVYDGTIPRTHLPVAYALVCAIALLWISAQKTSARSVFEDIAFSHLLFYFTK